MELFVKVVFWMGVVSFILRIITMGVREWPHVQSKSLGMFVGETLLSAAFTIWAAAVLWLH